MILFNLFNFSFEKEAFKNAPATLIVVAGIVLVLVLLITGVISCSTSNSQTENNQRDETEETQSSSGGDSQTIVQKSVQNSYSLYEENQIAGTIDSVKPTASDNLGNTYYDALIFRVSTLDDVDNSLAVQSITFANTENYSKFTGTFFVPKVHRTLVENAVNFKIILDGIPYEENYEVSINQDARTFNIDISNVTTIEIVCYFIEGTSSGVIGGGSYAYGALSNGIFTDPIVTVNEK